MEIKNQIIEVYAKELPFDVLRHFKQRAILNNRIPVKEFTDFNIITDSKGEPFKYIFIDSPKARDVLGCKDIEVSRKSYDDIQDSYRTSLEIKCGYTLYDYQQSSHDTVVDTFIDNKAPISRILIDLEPGAGKGLIANSVIATLGLIPIVLIKPTYVEKWIVEMMDHFKIPKEDFLILDSMKKLKSVTSNEGCKIIIMTTNLVTSALKDMETTEILKNLTTILNSELMLNDETHQHFDAVSNAVRLINPRYLIGLSASLTSNSRAEEKRQLNLFPKEVRLSYMKPMPYIDYLVTSYRAEGVGELDYKGSKGYNHNRFEESILRSDATFNEYMNIIIRAMRDMFVRSPDYTKGDRCIVFFSSKALIYRATNYIKDKLYKANSDLRVISYTGENKYEEVFDADIIIATAGKAGTAIDIPKLLYVLNTISIGSWQLNMQMPGRLRRRKDKKLVFEQLNCLSIPKHNEYTSSYLKRYGYMYKSVMYRQMEVNSVVMRGFRKIRKWNKKKKK